MNKQSLFSLLLLVSTPVIAETVPPIEQEVAIAADWTQDLPGSVFFLEEAHRSLDNFSGYDAVYFKSENNLLDTQDKVTFNFERNGQHYTLVVINADKAEAFSAYFAA